MKVFLTALLSIISLSIFAQDSLRIRKLDSILIIGVRADKKTPVSQQILKKEDIQRIYQGQELPSILDKTTSITSASDGGQPEGYTYFRLRGMDQSRVNMTLNSVGLNEPEDEGVYTSNYPGFANSIQSLQIQRGVGTSTNGVSSYAGSINFQSQNGFNKEADLSLGLGSYDTKRLNFTGGTGLVNKFAFFSSISLFSSDGYKYNSGGNGSSVFISGGYYGDKHILKFLAFSGTSQNGQAWQAVSESDIKKDPRTNYDQQDAHDNFTQSLIQLQDIRKFTLRSTLSTTLFYNRLDGEYDYFETGTNSVQLGSNFYGIISNYQYVLNKLRLNLGINLNDYDRGHKNTEDHLADLGIGTYSNRGYKNEFSSFGKISYDLHKFTLFGDAQYRYTDFRYSGDVQMRKIKWDFFNPKAGIMFNQNADLNYYFSVGKTSREPTRTNLFGGMDNLVQLVNIKPEEVVDYELGSNLHKKRISFQGNLYYMNFKNEITLLGVLGSNGLPLMTNVTRSFRSGLELDGKYVVVSKWFWVSTNLNWSYNRIKDGENELEPLYTPHLVVNEVATLDIRRFEFSAEAKYHSESYISPDNKFTTPEFVTLGFNTSYKYRCFMLLLQMNNLTNKRYYTSGYVINNERYFFVNGTRNFYLTLKISL